jgi:acylphosphatase
MPETAMTSDKQARRFFVSGRVQGVGYRYFVLNVAERLGISGYVKNLADGRVEVYAIGSMDQLRDFANELRRGPALANITDVEAAEAEILLAYRSGFSVAFR